MTAAPRSLESAIASALVTDVVVGICKSQDRDPPDFVGESARYAIMDTLGHGCSGSVYLARDARYSDDHHEEVVAVKVLRRDDSANEARKVRYVKHPNVVQSLDFGDGFIVFEYIPGGSLDSLCRPMKPRDAAKLIAQIADGVQAAHNQGLIHRDLKPANVLIDHDKTPKVADFGIAVLDSMVGPGHGEMTGNRAFMAPELFASGRSAITTKVDVYALGSLLYWLVTDSLPHGDTIEGIRESHKSKRIPTLRKVSNDLGRICSKAMAKDPVDRYATAGQLAADLRAHLAHEPIDWQRPGVVKRTRLLCRRRPAAAALGLFGFLLLMGGTTIIAFFMHEARSAEGRHAARFDEVTQGLVNKESREKIRSGEWRENPSP
jgi:serine/threonine protein kinase